MEERVLNSRVVRPEHLESQRTMRRSLTQGEAYAQAVFGTDR